MTATKEQNQQMMSKITELRQNLMDLAEIPESQQQEMLQEASNELDELVEEEQEPQKELD